MSQDTIVPTEIPEPIEPPFDTITQIAFGADPTGNPLEWTWVDVTEDVKKINGLGARRGRQDETRGVTPSSLELVLESDDGRYTPNNPASPYFGQVRLGTPIRVLPLPGENDLVSLHDTFDRMLTGQWGIPDVGLQWGGGAVEGQVYVDGSRGVTQIDDNGGALLFSAAQFFDGEITVKVGMSDVVGAGTSALFAGLTYRWIGYYMTVLVFDDAGNVDLQWYTNLGEVLVENVTGVATYAADDQLWLKVRTDGDRHRVKTWRVGDPEPAGWHIDRIDVGTPQNIGLISGPFGGLGGGFIEGWVSIFTQRIGTNDNDAHPNFDDITVINRNTPLYFGHVDQWEPTWPEGDISTEYDEGYSRVDVVAGGPLRRILQDNTTEFSSPVRRAIESFISSSTPIRAYWPMEESGRDIAEFASPIPGVEPMTTDGTILAGAGDMSTVPGSEPLPEFSEGATYIAPVPIGQYPHGWIVNHWFRMDRIVTTGGTRTVTRVDVQESDVAHWRARVTGAGDIFVEGIDDDWNQIDSFSTSITDEAFYNRWLVVSFRVSLDGPNLAFNLTVYGADTLNENVTTEIVAEIEDVMVASADGSGQPTRLAVFNMGVDTERSWGHMIVASIESDFSPDGAILFDQDAPSGYDGEFAVARFSRLVNEEDIPVSFIITDNTASSSSERMGPQRTGQTLTQNWEECEEADGAIIFESRHHSGLVWRSRSSLYRQAPKMLIDAEAGHLVNPLRPVLDDLRIRNDVTVSRVDGSSARAVDQLHVNQHGRRPRDFNLNVFSDQQLPGIAEWNLHVGTQEGMRYPTVAPYLSGYVDLQPPWLHLEIGDLIRIINLPPQHPPDVVDLLLQGTLDRITPETWQATLNAIPADAWTKLFGINAGLLGDGLCLTGEAGDYVSTPDSPALDVTGDLDIAFDATCSSWNFFDPAGSPGDIRRIGPAKWDQPNDDRSYVLDVQQGFPRLFWSTDGVSDFIPVTSRVAVPATGGERAAIRSTLSVDNGLGGYDVRFWYAPSMHAVQGMLLQNGRASTPDAPHLQNTGDIDVRAEFITDHRSGSDTFELISKNDPEPQRGWLMQVRFGVIEFNWSSDGTDSTVLGVDSPELIPGAYNTGSIPRVGGRLAVRVVIVANHNDEDDLFAISFYFAHSIEGPWYQIRQLMLFNDPNSPDGTTSIFNTDAPLRVGPPPGSGDWPMTVTRAELYTARAYPYPTPGPDDPILPLGVQTASPDFRNLPHGTTNFLDAQGNPWTLGGDAEISPWALMDHRGTFSGTTMIAATDAPLEFGSIDDGGRGNNSKDDNPSPMKIHSAYVKDGINGTVVADPDFENLPAGTRQFTDGVGNTYTLHSDQTSICDGATTDEIALSRLSPTDAYLAFNVTPEQQVIDVLLDVRRPLNPSPGFEDPNVSILQDTDPTATTFTDYIVTNGVGERVTTRSLRGEASALFTFDGGNPGSVSTQAFYGGGTNNSWRRASAWAWSQNDVSLFIAIAFFDTEGQGSPLVRRQVYYSNARFIPAETWTRITVAGAATDGTDVDDPQDAEAVNTAGAIVFINGAPTIGQQLYLDEFKFGMDSAPFIATHEAPHQFPFGIKIGGEVMQVIAADPINRHNVQRLYVLRGQSNTIARAYTAGEGIALDPAPNLAL